MPDLRVVIAGGGTGGHILPGLAIARELRDRHNAEVRFVGTARGLESRLVPPAGFPLELIASGPLSNVSLATRLRSAWAVPHGVWQCVALLRAWRTQAVISVGGYAAGPCMAAAALLRIPCMLFEPNAEPGLTNRIADRWARVAAVNFAAASKRFRHAEVTGIPVRAEFFAIAPRPPNMPPHLLIFGGSQGARVLNETAPLALQSLFVEIPRMTVMHQTGTRNYDSVVAAYAAIPAAAGRVIVAPFLDDMAAEFARADLVLARSGASTVAELAAAGRPAVLVPFAAAAGDHQTKNAEAFADEGAAVVLRESELKAARLSQVLQGLLTEPARLQRMAELAGKQARPHAATRIAELAASIARTAASPT